MTELDLRIRRPLREHTKADWPAWTSEAKVLADMCRLSGLQDKAIAIETGIDTAVLSRVQAGQARLSEESLDRLMDVVGDEAWLQYWLLRRGYDPMSLRRLESDLQRENRELRERLDALENEREIEIKLISRLRVA